MGWGSREAFPEASPFELGSKGMREAEHARWREQQEPGREGGIPGEEEDVGWRHITDGLERQLLVWTRGCGQWGATAIS